MPLSVLSDITQVHNIIQSTDCYISHNVQSSGCGKKLDRPIKNITYSFSSVCDMNVGVQIKLKSNEYTCRIQFFVY